jgi:hypothetical protein
MSRILPLAALALAMPGIVRAQARLGMGGATMFTVRVENVSTPQTLPLSTGGAAPAPTAPVLWVVHTGANPVFTDGQLDRAQGLERLAEDGNPTALAAALGGRPGIVSVGALAIPVGDTQPGPITPGKAYEFSVTARPGQKLTLAFMFGQSNDLFYAPSGQGIDLFAAGPPARGELTTQLLLWDAGTEVNEEPGVGPNQAPRQAMPDMGPRERKPVALVNDGFRYPPVGQVIRVTVTPIGDIRMM